MIRVNRYFENEVNLVPRVLRGHWERGWQEAALWEGKESFCAASSSTPSCIFGL